MTQSELLVKMELHCYHLSFLGTETTKPSVIGWAPAAAINFRGSDNHLTEYLTMLDHNLRLDLGIIPWSEWLAKS